MSFPHNSDFTLQFYLFALPKVLLSSVIKSLFQIKSFLILLQCFYILPYCLFVPPAIISSQFFFSLSLSALDL